MVQCHCELFYHLVWSTHERIPYLDLHLRKVTRDLLAAKAIMLGCRVIAINCMEDHVHLVLWVPAKLAISRVVCQIKGFSSHELRARHCATFSWQDGYGAFTVRANDLKNLQAYIANQEEHHRHNC